jgi:hypothetical protein
MVLVTNHEKNNVNRFNIKLKKKKLIKNNLVY